MLTGNNMIKKIFNKTVAYISNMKPDNHNNVVIDNQSYQKIMIDNYYYAGNLKQKRVNASDIEQAFKKARHRFADSRIYYINDIYPIDVTYKNAVIIDYASIPNDVAAINDDVKVFICAFESDEKLVNVIKWIMTLDNSYYFMPSKYYPTSRYFHRNDIARQVLTSDLAINLSKFEVADFENIIQAIEITRNVQGDYVEVGVYQGRSAHLALHYFKEAGITRKSYFFDVFDGFTYDVAITSSDALWANTHTETSLESVERFLAEFDNFEIYKLDIIAEDLPSKVKNIAVCNIDVDMYEAVCSALDKVAPRMESGGIMIVEDQGHTPALAGAYLAVTEFLDKDIAKGFIPVHMASGQLFLIKK